MADFALDEADNTDIGIVGGNLTIVDGTDAIAQHLLIRLRFFKGEYQLDRSIGVPYFEDIFVKNPSLVVVRAIMREVILETPGVLEITRFDLSVDSAIRQLNVDFTVQVSTSDELLDFSETFLIG